MRKCDLVMEDYQWHKAILWLQKTWNAWINYIALFEGFSSLLMAWNPKCCNLFARDYFCKINVCMYIFHTYFKYAWRNGAWYYKDMFSKLNNWLLYHHCTKVKANWFMIFVQDQFKADKMTEKDCHTSPKRSLSLHWKIEL